MPKKSKQEKIIADLRRKIPKISDPEHTNEAKYTFSSSHSTSAVPPVSTAADMKELTFIKSDLVKTVIFAGIAIGFELALFWVKKGNI